MSDRPSPAAVERLSDFEQATVDPDGDRVAFYHTDTSGVEIRVLELKTGDAEQWTEGNAGTTVIWPLAWTDDGERVLYHRDATAGAERYDLYAVDAEGRSEPIVETDGTTQLRGVSDDGDTLLVRSTRDGSMDAYLYERSNGTFTRLTDRAEPIYWPILGPGADRVAYPADGSVYVCDRTGSVEHVVEVGDEDSTTMPVDWGSDGTRLLLTDDAPGAKRSGSYDLATGETRWVGRDTRVEDAECFLPDGRRFVALRERDALTVPVVCDLETGSCREFELPDGVARFGRHAARLVDDTTLLVSQATPTRPARLVTYDVSDDTATVVFSTDRGPFTESDFARPAYDRVTSDGVPQTRQAAVAHDQARSFEIETLLWDAGERPSPLVVYPHGGPHQSSRRTFDPHVQFLCLHGYAVLQVNYRGSSGRGRAFSRALHGDWGGAEAGDVATAVEHAIDSYGYIDPDRIAVYGGSFGGFAACWQLLQYPDLYAAGAVVVGMTDLEDMYENTRPQFRNGFLRTHLGSPEENPELYRERSPVTHAANLNAPLLLVHGANDPRVPVSQARRFRDALLDAGYETGRDVEYHELEEQGHWRGSGGVSRSQRLLIDFLDRRLST